LIETLKIIINLTHFNVIWKKSTIVDFEHISIIFVVLDVDEN